MIDIDAGIVALRGRLIDRKDTTVALPAIGCGEGGCSWPTVRALIEDLLGELECQLLVYEPLKP